MALRLMYDAVDAWQIPTDAHLVAGYVDAHYKWTDEAWARFPSSVKVRIACLSSTNDGHVLDCERGNCKPLDAVYWVQMRRKSGAIPTVYCNLDWYDQIVECFQAAREPQPLYWVAHWDGVARLSPGYTAKQFETTPHYDLSLVHAYWPGVDPAQRMTCRHEDIPAAPTTAVP